MELIKELIKKYRYYLYRKNNLIPCPEEINELDPQGEYFKEIKIYDRKKLSSSSDKKNIATYKVRQAELSCQYACGVSIEELSDSLKVSKLYVKSRINAFYLRKTKKDKIS